MMVKKDYKIIKYFHQESEMWILHAQISDEFFGEVIIGTLSLKSSGEISTVNVSSYRRREGIATALYEFAMKHPDIPNPKHSNFRTSLGNAWAQAVGGEIPDNKLNLDKRREILL